LTTSGLPPGRSGNLNTGAADSVALRDYLRIAIRRKWVIVLALVLTPAVAVVLSMRHQSLYRSSAQVLVSQQSVGSALTGVDTSAITRARLEVQKRIDELVAGGERRSPFYTSLVEKEQVLQTAAALLTSNESVVRTAGGAAKIAPRPTRDGLIGLGLGLVLGL